MKFAKYLLSSEQLWFNQFRIGLWPNYFN